MEEEELEPGGREQERGSGAQAGAAAAARTRGHRGLRPALTTARLAIAAASSPPAYCGRPAATRAPGPQHRVKLQLRRESERQSTPRPALGPLRHSPRFHLLLLRPFPPLPAPRSQAGAQGRGGKEAGCSGSLERPRRS